MTRFLGSGAFSAAEAKRRAGKPPDLAVLRAVQAVVSPGASVLDLGAGPGRYVVALRNLGYDCWGVDGSPGVRELSGGLIEEHDLCDERPPNLYRVRWDWAICVEVGEHVPEVNLGAFLRTLCAVPASGLLVSWAVPGQRGRRHVSCRRPEWVVRQLAERGWGLDAEATLAARRAAGGGFARKLLAFRPLTRS